MGTLELVGVTPKYLTTVNSSSFETFGLGSQVPVRKVIRYIFPILYFVHPIFVIGFWSLLVTKLRKYYVIFLYILQVKMDKTEKNGMKVMQLK